MSIVPAVYHYWQAGGSVVKTGADGRYAKPHQSVKCPVHSTAPLSNTRTPYHPIGHSVTVAALSISKLPCYSEGV